MNFLTALTIRYDTRSARTCCIAAALALVVCGGTIAGAEGNRIPGVYDPVAKTFRLYPIPVAPAAGSPKIYTGTLTITAKIFVSVPAGTTISGYADASASDYAGGFDDTASNQITASGKTATMEFTIPYATRLGDPSDKVSILVSVRASYRNKKGVGLNPSDVGTASIALPKDGTNTKVTVYVGV